MTTFKGLIGVSAMSLVLGTAGISGLTAFGVDAATQRHPVVVNDENVVTLDPNKLPSLTDVAEEDVNPASPQSQEDLQKAIDELLKEKDQVKQQQAQIQEIIKRLESEQKPADEKTPKEDDHGK